MADLTSNIDFTAMFRVGGINPTLSLTNTGNYPGTVVGSFVVTPPNGVPITVTGLLATINLPPATDGTAQMGVYKIQCVVTDNSPQTSQLARVFPLRLTMLLPKPVQHIDYALPGITYTDSQTYVQAGYNAPTLIRAWLATREGVFNPLTSTAEIFDLQDGGYYTDSKYTVSLAATGAYTATDTALSWATVIVAYTITSFVDAKALPSLDVIRGWIKTPVPDDCNCGCPDETDSAACIYALIKDYACAGDYEAVYNQVAKLYKLTHNGKKYNPVHSNAILTAVKLCPDAAIAIPGTYAFQYGYATSNPYINNTTVPADVIWFPAQTVTSINAALVLLNTITGYANIDQNYLLLRHVSTIAARTRIQNPPASLNDYPIATVFRPYFTVAGQDYLVSIDIFGLDINNDITTL